MSAQTKGLKRDTTDKYYTAPHIVKFCVDKFREVIPNIPNSLIIEPSAGNGAFIPAIKELTSNHLFYDIKPDPVDNGPQEIQEADFLKLDIKDIMQTQFPTMTDITFMGNPPFGRQSSLAIKFIKRACEVANTVAFILPKSFKKDSLKQKVNPYFHLVLEEDIPEKAFLVNSEAYTVPCVFQVWHKRDYKREIPPKLIPSGFEFVKQNEAPDLAFRRVGVYAGNFYKDYANKSEQSHYFIKFDADKPLTSERFEQLEKIEFITRDNTVGARSISKQDLIKELIMVF
jgi:predicted RNA methylase